MFTAIITLLFYSGTNVGMRDLCIPHHHFISSAELNQLSSPESMPYRVTIGPAHQPISGEICSINLKFLALFRRIVTIPVYSTTSSASTPLVRWLGNSKSQVILNSAAVCHVRIDRLDAVSVAAQFVGLTENCPAASHQSSVDTKDYCKILSLPVHS
jgi:hypothetical protein